MRNVHESTDKHLLARCSLAPFSFRCAASRNETLVAAKRHAVVFAERIGTEEKRREEKRAEVVTSYYEGAIKNE